MKQIFLFLIFAAVCGMASAQVGIGTTAPANSAVLDLTSSSKGFLPPRMTAVNRIALPSPVAGLVVFDTDSATLFIYQQAAGWRKMLPVSNLGSIIAGTGAGDVLMWNGTAWVVTPKCNLYNVYFRDKDGDGKGDRYSPFSACAPIAGFVADSLDCDDNNALIGLTKQYRDADGDGAGDINVSVSYCTPQPGYVFNSSDCDDTDPAINPTNPDLPDDSFIDANCDGIDGKESSAIFVSPLGNDANAGTKALPAKTIGAGITKAAAGAKTQVLVAAGTYNETVTMQTGISIYGGYDAVTWARATANTTTINGQGGPIYCGVNAGVANITVDLFTINGPNATGATGAVANSGYGIYGANPSNAIIKNCRITAGSGAAGIAGTAGTIGANGGNGTQGNTGSCDNNAGGGGGAGGVSTCGRTGGAGGGGGFGGPGAAGAAGAGGTAGGAGGVYSNPGSYGDQGANGSAGANGAAGTGATNALGAPVTGIWAGTAGNDGGAAVGGNGGGGGGGGGGQNIIFSGGRGNGGSGGGAGGCPGASGTGGTAGGGSIAIFFAAHGTGVTIANNLLKSGSGGVGGIGGSGAAGGAGGTGGGVVTFCDSEIGGGRPGGNGGAGGKGSGGGGGAGGISYGIYTSTGGVTYAGNTFTIGTPGTGGSGGASSGNAGTAGVAGAAGNTYP